MMLSSSLRHLTVIDTRAGSAGLIEGSSQLGRSAPPLSTVTKAALGGFRWTYRVRGLRNLASSHRLTTTHRFFHRGGVAGAFDRTARQVGRGRAYRTYWGAKLHAAGVGAGWAPNYYGSRCRDWNW